MPDPIVRYFDFAGSRGEEVRLALVIAGVPFDDERLTRDDLARIKADLPFGSLPVLEFPERGIFSQTNAILRLIGRLHHLHPDDPWDAARHDAVLEACEDLRHRISATSRIAAATERQIARKNLADGFIPHWAKGIEALIGEKPFVGGTLPAVADVKIYMMDKALRGGAFDDIPTTVLDPFARIGGVARGVSIHPPVQAWYAR